MSGALSTFNPNLFSPLTPVGIPTQAPGVLSSLAATPATQAVGMTSPLAGSAEEAALASLMSIVNPDAAGTSAQGQYGGAGKQGQASSGNVAQDARNAYNSGMFGFAANLATNPASMITGVPATMAAAAIRGLTGMPEPTSLRSGWGLQGLMNTLSGVFGDRAAQHAEAAKAGDMYGRGGADAQGGGKDKPDAAPMGYGGWGDDMGGDKAGGGGGKGDTSGMGDATSEGSATGGEDGGAKAGGGLVKPSDGRVIPLAGGGKIAIGPGGGLDDLIPTSINGRRAAALSDGEFVIPADVVSMFGDGSTNAGARRLYDLVRQVRENKTGQSKQAGPLPVGEILKRSLR